MLADMILTAAEAGALIDATADRVRQLARVGWLKKIGRDQYRAPDVIAGYIKFLKDENRRGSQADEERQQARAKKAENGSRSAGQQASRHRRNPRDDG